MRAIFLVLLAMYLLFFSQSYEPNDYGEYPPAKFWLAIASAVAVLWALIMFIIEFFI